MFSLLTCLQLFQKDPNAPKPPAPENPVKDEGGFKLPSFGLPSFSAPSLPDLPAGPKDFTPGGLDVRAIALPGQWSN